MRTIDESPILNVLFHNQFVYIGAVDVLIKLDATQKPIEVARQLEPQLVGQAFLTL